MKLLFSNLKMESAEYIARSLLDAHRCRFSRVKLSSWKLASCMASNNFNDTMTVWRYESDSQFVYNVGHCWLSELLIVL